MNENTYLLITLLTDAARNLAAARTECSAETINRRADALRRAVKAMPGHTGDLVAHRLALFTRRSRVTTGDVERATLACWD